MENHKPLFVFRVDAGITTGTGHLMEIVSLIKSLRRRFDFHALAIVNSHPICQEKLSPLVEELKILPDDISWNNEVTLIKSFLSNRDCSILTIDLLMKPHSYYSLLRSMARITCAIFDNTVHQQTDASIVVNFNIIQDLNYYETYGLKNTDYLIGPFYALIDESLYYEWTSRLQFHETVERIFVNQGGSDPFSLTAKIIRALRILDLRAEIIVVVGGACADATMRDIEIEKNKATDNFVFYNNVLPQNIHELMFSSDLAITAAGNLLYELAFFGVPSIIVCHHQNHHIVANRFEELNCAVNLGMGKYIREEEIAEAVSKLMKDHSKRQMLSVNARNMVDGYGMGRLADKLFNAACE